MATLVIKKVKGHRYYYGVECARVNGKPRIVRQVYLGKVDSMIEARKRMSQAPVKGEPTHSVILEFGAVSALLDVAERLEVRKIIDKHAGKRAQGLAVGDQILLAAINRAVEPKSKNEFYDGWFRRTVLPKTFPLANAKNMSSQGFWNNMSILTEEKIKLIEEEITINAIKNYNIPINCLLFDNTNFFTYIDTDNKCTLAQRGKSKEHRSDLKIIGLSLMASNYHNIPLFHEIYPGNTNDAKRFSEIIDKLKTRCTKVGISDDQITLIFDRGNNSKSNIEKLLDENPYKFHFIGGLKQNQSKNLLLEAENKYQKLNDPTLGDTLAYRTTTIEYEMTMTVVLTHNPELFDKQMRGILNNIENSKIELNDLIKKLEKRINGIITKGKKYTEESLKKRIDNILDAEHMKEIFDINIFYVNNTNLLFNYKINEEKFENLKSIYIGKSVLFTDRHNWTNEEIIGAYRSQYHVEECFKQMKNTQYLSFRPVRHFTDGKIRVHAFYCVLSLLLCSLLNVEIENLGFKISINKMLCELNKIKQVITNLKVDNRITTMLSFTEFNKIAKLYNEKYCIDKYSIENKKEIIKKFSK